MCLTCAACISPACSGGFESTPRGRLPRTPPPGTGGAGAGGPDDAGVSQESRGSLPRSRNLAAPESLDQSHCRSDKGNDRLVNVGENPWQATNQSGQESDVASAATVPIAARGGCLPAT